MMFARLNATVLVPQPPQPVTTIEFPLDAKGLSMSFTSEDQYAEGFGDSLYGNDNQGVAAPQGYDPAYQNQQQFGNQPEQENPNSGPELSVSNPGAVSASVVSVTV